MNSPQLRPAWILHQRPYRNTSRIIEAFTRDDGRVGLVARGVQRGRGPLAALLHPFRPLLMAWSGRGELRTLTRLEPDDADAPTPIRPLSGRRLYSGLYLNELMMRLLQRADPHPRLCAVYADAVRALAAGAPEAPLLRLFEKRLLEEIGFGLDLRRDREGAEISAVARYRCAPGETLERIDNGWGSEQGVVRGATLLQLQREELAEGDPESRRELRRLLGAALAVRLGPRPLKSREMLRRL